MDTATLPAPSARAHNATADGNGPANGSRYAVLF